MPENVTMYAPRETCSFRKDKDPLDCLLEEREIEMIIKDMISKGLISFEPKMEDIEVVYNLDNKKNFLIIGVGEKRYRLISPNYN